MKLSILSLDGQQVGEHQVGFSLVDQNHGRQAVHDAVTAYLANGRSGTASTKTAGEVAGTNKKPWRQKGTGRARAGSHQSPLWVGGGVVFGPKPRSYAKKVSQKTRKLAISKALTERLQASDVLLVNDEIEAITKTKEFAACLDRFSVVGTATVVFASHTANAIRASRNLPLICATTSATISTYDLLKCDKIIFTRSAFEQIEKRIKQHLHE